MFTLKLYRTDQTTLIEVARLDHRIVHGQEAVEIAAMLPNGDMKYFRVGGPGNDENPAYDRAIIENAAGKTSEIIQPPPRHDPLKEAQQRYAERISGTQHPV